MKSKIKIIFYFAAGIAAVFAALYFAGLIPSGKKIEPGSAKNKPLPQSGNRLVLEEEDIPLVYSTVGTIHSRDEIEISVRITAKITNVIPREGDVVRKGDILVSLDDSDLKAGLAKAKEKLNEAQSLLTLQEKELARFRILHEKEAVAKRTLEMTESSYDAAKAGLAAANEAVKEAEANLSYASIVSPMDGIISKRYLDPGDLALPGLKILEMFDSQRLMLYAPVSESMVSKIKLGEPMSFNVESIGKTFNGEVKEIAQIIDTGSRTFLVKICVGGSKDLMPGMFGRLSFRTGSEKAVLIPEKALIRNGQLEYVLKMEHDGSPMKMLVRTTPSGITGKLRLVSGLNPGDTIIVPE